MKKYKNFALALVFSLLTLAPVSTIPAQAVAFQPVQTLASAGKQDACNGLEQVGGSCGSGESRLGNVLHGVVIIISYIAGIIAIIMIIISGIRFITSAGDSTRVSTAKTALVYALIGLAVAALAQLLAHFVISNAASA